MSKIESNRNYYVQRYLLYRGCIVFVWEEEKIVIEERKS